MIERTYVLTAFDRDKQGVRRFMLRAFDAKDADAKFDVWRRRCLDAKGEVTIGPAWGISPYTGERNENATVIE